MLLRTLILLLVCFSAGANPLKLTQHRWSVGGDASLAYYFEPSTLAGFELGLKPQASYFVWDGLELSLAGHVSALLFSNDPYGYEKQPARWGLGFAARYYFDVGRIFFPYVGLFAGFNMINNWSGSFRYELGPTTGLLIALTDSLALDVSLVIKATLVGTNFVRAEIAPTTLGIRYFF